MEKITFDFNASMASLAQFRQAMAAASAAMTANVSTHMTALSASIQKTADIANASFGDAFADINAFSSESSNRLSESFGSAALDSISSLRNMQAYGEVAHQELKNVASVSASIMESAYANAAEISSNSLADLKSHGAEQFASLADSATDASAKATDSTLSGIASLKASLASLKDFGTEQFAVFSQNATDSFTETRESIYDGADHITARIAEMGATMRADVERACDGMVADFSGALDSMHSESSTRFVGIAELARISSSNIRNRFNEAFSDTLENLRQLRDSMAPVLGTMGQMFSATADNARQVFADSLGAIAENVAVLGVTVAEMEEKATSSFKKLYQTLSMVYMTATLLKYVVMAIKPAISANTVAKNKNSAANAKNSLSLKKIAGAGKLAAKGVAMAGTGFLKMGIGALLAAKALVILSAVTGVGGGREMLGDITGTIRYLRNPGTPTFADPPTYRADGSFVSTGQMFVAREAGPELVGTIGRRTAVANNDQIVESVARGVFEAVSAANAGGNSNGNNRPLEIKLYLDGRQITDAVERVQKERGLPLLTSGIHTKRVLMAKGLV